MGRRPLVSVHCPACFGSGQVRKRNFIGVITYDNCKRCKGIGRIMVEEGSGLYRAGKMVGAIGLWPNNPHKKYF